MITIRSFVYFFSIPRSSDVFSTSIGISHGDDTLHIGFDQHDDLNHPVSKDGVVTDQTKVA